MSDDVIATKELASQRYISLVRQLGAERAFGWGWQVEVAKILGVSENYVGKLHAGTRSSVGVTAIERAVQRLHLDRTYFYGDPLREDPPYKDYQHGTGDAASEAARTAKAVAAFRETPDGEQATEDELELLGRLRFGEITPTVEMIRAIWVEVRLRSR